MVLGMAIGPAIDGAPARQNEGTETLAGQTAPAAEKVPARKKGRERRQQILEVARRKLLDSGIEGLVLRDVAEDLGITHGNLQYYFKTKSDLIEAIFDEEVSKFTEIMPSAAEGASTRSGRISALVDSSIDLLPGEDTKLWQMLFGMAPQNPELAKLLERENERYEVALAAQLEWIIPEATAARRMHVAKVIRVIVDGLGVTAIYEKPDGPSARALRSEIKVLIEHMLEMK